MPDPYDDLIRGIVGSKPKGTNYDPDTALDLISQHESGGRNIKQNIVPAGGGYNPSVGRVTGPSTAGGPWQITNTTWGKRAPKEIAQKYPTAMSAPVEVQREVARKMFTETGFDDWAPYNASLRKAIGRGDQPAQQKPSTPQNDDYSKLIREVTQESTPKTPLSSTPSQGWGKGTIGQGIKTAPVASERPRTRPKGIGGAQIAGEVAPSGGPQARQDLRRVSQAGGVTGGLLSLLPESAGDFITQGAAGAVAPLMQLGAGLIKKIPGVQDPLDPQRSDVTAPIRQQLNQGATKLQQENAAIDQSSQHYNVNVPVVGNVSTKDVREMGSGLVSSAPALVLQRMGVPGPVAFGLDAYLKAEGRDADFADVMKETGLATLTGGLYEIPLPARMGLIKQIGAKLGLGTTGGYLLAKAFGLPEDEARKMAAQTGFMMATGAKRGVAPELAEAIPASKPREFAPTLAPSELAQRTGLRDAGTVPPAVQPEFVGPRDRGIMPAATRPELIGPRPTTRRIFRQPQPAERAESPAVETADITAANAKIETIKRRMAEVAQIKNPTGRAQGLQRKLETQLADALRERNQLLDPKVQAQMEGRPLTEVLAERRANEGRMGVTEEGIPTEAPAEVPAEVPPQPNATKSQRVRNVAGRGQRGLTEETSLTKAPPQEVQEGNNAPSKTASEVPQPTPPPEAVGTESPTTAPRPVEASQDIGYDVTGKPVGKKGTLTKEDAMSVHLPDNKALVYRGRGYELAVDDPRRAFIKPEGAPDGTYYRGTRPGVKYEPDRFYTSTREATDLYAGSTGTVEEVSAKDLPKNLYHATNKGSLRQDLGIGPIAGEKEADGIVRDRLGKLGYDGVYYRYGSVGESEVHVFPFKGKEPATTEPQNALPPAAASPAAVTPKISLSYDVARGENREVRYNIKAENQELAALITIKPNGNADVELTGAGAGSLGVRNVLALKKQMLELHPEIKAIEFKREGSTGGVFGREKVLPVKPSSTAPRPVEETATEVPQVTPEEPARATSPVASSPETKPSRLAQGVEAKAVEANLTQGFGELRSYTPVTVKDQAQRALKLLDENPEQARRIAMGDEEPPKGLHPESVFTAVENRALASNDVNTLMDLATKSTRASEDSVLGQRIRMLRERNPNSPVAAISKIEKARSASVPKERLAKTANKIKTEVQVEMKKSVPKADAWQKFLGEIVCR